MDKVTINIGSRIVIVLKDCVITCTVQNIRERNGATELETREDANTRRGDRTD